MKLPSFRLRVALLSAALAGSALVGFGAVSWFQIYNAQIGRLDAELFNQLMRATGPPNRERQRLERWQRYEDSLSYAFGTNTKTPIALLVLDANGDTLYQSNSHADKDVNRLLVQRLRLTLPLPKPPNQNPSALASPFIKPPPPPPRFVTEQTVTGAWRIGAVRFPNAQVAIA